jgi:hypothetical protein
MFGEKFNQDDVFIRDLTICLLDTLEGRIKWVNRFTNGDKEVNVPFYYSMSGDERFLLDSFQDDIVSNNRGVELNTDIIPRAHITYDTMTIKSDEFRNPNVWLRSVVESKTELKSQLRRMRAIPITVSYSMEVLLKTEIDVFKCSQSILNTLWLYQFMYFEHNFMHIDAYVQQPDNSQIEILREKNLSSDNSIKLKSQIEVHTFYPAFLDEDVKDIKPMMTKWFSNLKNI